MLSLDMLDFNMDTYVFVVTAMGNMILHLIASVTLFALEMKLILVEVFGEIKYIILVIYFIVFQHVLKHIYNRKFFANRDLKTYQSICKTQITSKKRYWLLCTNCKDLNEIKLKQQNFIHLTDIMEITSRSFIKIVV